MDKEGLLSTTLEKVISSKDYEKVKTILINEIDVNDEFYNILYKIIDNPEIDENLAHMLLTSTEININRQLNPEDHTALHCLAYHGHVKLLQNIFQIYNDIEVDATCKKGRTPFIFAAMKNQIDVLEVLKTQNANINQQDEYGWGALHYASCKGYQGCVPAVKKLIELGVNPDIKNGLGETALMKAAQTGIREIVAVLLQSGARANIKCKQDNTALDYAARKWHGDCIKLLIEKTDNLDGKDRQGKTLLMKTVNMTDVEILSCLLDRGVKINEKCNKGFSALNYAVVKGNLDCVKLLLNDANVDCKDAQGQTILMKAAGFGQDRILQYIIDSFPHTDINDTCSDNRTALDYAAWGGYIRCVEILVTHGADIETKDLNGQTPLIKAAGFGHLETVEYLLESGAQIENSCKKERTALNYACYNGKLDCAKKLIDYNADIHTRDIEQQTPLSKAAGFANAELVQYLISRGAAANTVGQETSALGFAAKNGSLESVKLLLKNGADIKFRTIDGFTTLIEASIHGNLDILQHLLSYDIMDVDEACNAGRTALIHASYFGHLSCVKALLQNGANINHSGYDGETPIFKAIGKNHCNVTLCLLENGANIHLTSKEGRYPLIEAAYKGCLECVSALVAYGADVNFNCNKFQETALLTALKFNFDDIVAFLLQAGADIYQTNGRGWTALYLAKKYYPRMLEVIKRYRRIIE